MPLSRCPSRTTSCFSAMSERRPPPPPPRKPPPPPPPRKPPPPPPRPAKLGAPPPRGPILAMLARPRADCAAAALPDDTFMAPPRPPPPRPALLPRLAALARSPPPFAPRSAPARSRAPRGRRHDYQHGRHHDHRRDRRRPDDPAQDEAPV